METSEYPIVEKLEFLWYCVTTPDCLMNYWFRVLMIIILIALILFIIFTKRPVVIRSKWQYFFADYQLSSEDFYRSVEAQLTELQLPKARYEKETFFEKHLLSAKRIYLTVSRNEFVFFISAAHFGTGSFVSWWFTEEIEGPLNKIPFVSKWLLGRRRDRKTLFQMDSEAMFKAAVHKVITDIVEELHSQNGIRPLTERERQYTDIA